MKQPVLDTDSESSCEHFDSGSQSRAIHHSAPDRWQDLPVKSFKFIDDLNGREKCDVTDCEAVMSTQKEVRHLHARKLEFFFLSVCSAAERMGMKVNPQKTQLLCTTTAIN